MNVLETMRCFNGSLIACKRQPPGAFTSSWQ
ncbi:hypothetical protein GQ607_001421 [Colletotrichum asianum]|uniref:Uncharacterized protein n=1 Tax=Colletotrichum asianum TaxID=702518 RepID=A0A8H3WUC6_9PEZI|nr:hypothetical protein GQ607_001421 [Colletotrichum asianum]